jgi:anti-anti-sigma factor
VKLFEIRDDELGVAVSGEIDINAIDALDTMLDTKIRTTTGAFIVDLSKATFLDSSGLATLMRARGLLGTYERQLALICPPGPVRRTFELTSTAELFVIYSSRDEAVAALVPAD